MSLPALTGRTTVLFFASSGRRTRASLRRYERYGRYSGTGISDTTGATPLAERRSGLHGRGQPREVPWTDPPAGSCADLGERLADAVAPSHTCGAFVSPVIPARPGACAIATTTGGSTGYTDSGSERSRGTTRGLPPRAHENHRGLVNRLIFSNVCCGACPKPWRRRGGFSTNKGASRQRPFAGRLEPAPTLRWLEARVLRHSGSAQ